VPTLGNIASTMFSSPNTFFTASYASRLGGAFQPMK
jgi:hypothetical protein